jgi:stage V sporulation protein B
MVLTVAVAVTKVIGFLYKIPLGNLLDREGMAHFYAAYNIYNLLLMLSTAGLPLALSRMVAEAEALGQENQKRRIFRTALGLFFALGALCSAVMLLLARPLSLLLHDSLALWPIRVLSPAVLCVCVMSAIRGYTQGQGNMKPTAASQIIESLCKLLVGLTAAWLLLRRGAPTHIAAAGAIAGVTVGTVVGMLALTLYLLQRRGGRRGTDVPRSRRAIVHRLVTTGVPITVGAAGMSLITLLDQALVMGTLQRSLGLDEVRAAGLYGEYTFGMNLFALPSSFIYPLAISLIPAISTALACRDRRGAARHTAAALRITALLALPCGVGLSVLAGPILALLYPGGPAPAAAAAVHLRILGIASIFVCLMAVTNSILQAYGRERLPMWSLLLGGAVKVIGSLVLISRPAVGVRGAPISTLLCYGVVAAVNLLAVRRVVRVPVRYRECFLRPLVCAAVMGAAAWGSYGLLGRALGTHMAVIPAVAIAAAVYGILVLALGAVRREDVIPLPHGEKLAKWLHLR